MNTIYFYRVDDLFGEFSNFRSSPILIASEIWPTVEHYFQANKFDDFNLRDKIRGISSPIEAAKEVRSHKNKIRSDNRVENLEWMTRSENMIHAYST